MDTNKNDCQKVSLPGAEETEQAIALETQQSTNIVSALPLKQHQQQEQKELVDVDAKTVELDNSDITKDNAKTIIDSAQSSVEESNLDDQPINIQLVSSEICETLENENLVKIGETEKLQVEIVAVSEVHLASLESNLDHKSIDIQIVSPEVCETLEIENLVKIEETDKLQVESLEVSDVQTPAETAEDIKLSDRPSSETLELTSDYSSKNPVVLTEEGTISDQKSDEIIKKKKPVIEQIVTEVYNKEQQEVLTDIKVVPSEEFDEEKPPLPLPTYLWEDIKRKKHQGGYPWTHIYKQPLGPDEEPETILKFKCSPKGRRKFEEQFLHLEDSTADELSDKQEIPDEEIDALEELPLDETVEKEAEEAKEENITEELVTATQTSAKSSKFSPKSILKRPHLKFLDKKDSSNEAAQESSPSTSVKTLTKIKCCHPFVEKIKTMADKQLHRVTNRKNIKKIPVANNEIVLEDAQTILKLKESPRSHKREIVSFIEKQDSDDIVEIVALEESPSESRKRQEGGVVQQVWYKDTTVVPDEIIQLPISNDSGQTNEKPPSDNNFENKESVDELLCQKVVLLKKKNEPAPPKMPRKQKEHVYEDIDNYECDETPTSTLERKLKRQNEVSGFDPLMQEFLGNESLQISLKIQDDQILSDVRGKKTHLDELVTQSSEEQEEKQVGLLAPMSSIDSTSSDEGRSKTQLSALVEESDVNESCDDDETLRIIEDGDKINGKEFTTLNSTSADIKSILKAEASPLSLKKISFSPSTDDDRLEDMDLKVGNRWSKMSDHEYEPIGEPIDQPPTAKPADVGVETEGTLDGYAMSKGSGQLTKPIDADADKVSMQDIQDEMEARFRCPTPTTSGTDLDVHTSQVNSSALESLPLKKESRQKRMMMSAQERSRKISTKFKTQAGKIKTKMSKMKKPKRSQTQDEEPEETTPAGTEDSQATPVGTEGSQTTPESQMPSEEMETEEPAKVKSRFRTPERFKNMHMPKINRPQFKFPSNMKKPKRTQPPKDGQQEITPTGTEGSQATPVGTEGSQTLPESQLPSEEMETEEPAKEKRRFRTPERFKNMRMPKINRPQFKRPSMPKMPPMPKMKAPEMPKFKKPTFTRPEMLNFHVQEKFNSFRLKRSKSLKEPSATLSSVDTASYTTETTATPPKKRFDITFGTYPRILNKLKGQKSGSGASRMRQDTPPPLEFSTVPKSGVQRTGKIVSRYPEEEAASDAKYTDNESGKYQQYDSEQDMELNRESSVERRMKLHFQQKATADADEAGMILTDEQKQMEEFDKENREIHQISKSKEQDFKQRKPIERQESDLTSEEEKQFWRSPLGQKIKQSYDTNGNESFDLDVNEHLLPIQHDANTNELRSSTPHTNQETQSSGSSAARRMKDVLDEIEHNELFLRQQMPDNDDIPIGQYVHSAIREGFENPVNTLARMGRFDSSYDEDYSAASDKIAYPPAKPGRSKKPMKFNISGDSEDMLMAPNMDDSFDNFNGNNYNDDQQNDYFKTFPPSKPLRKQPQKSQYCAENEEVPYVDDDYYENERMKGIEQVTNNNHYDDENIDHDLSLHDSELLDDDIGIVDQNHNHLHNIAVPPTPPRRRKKRFRDFSASLDRGGNDMMNRFTERSISNTMLPNMEQQQNVLIYRTQHEYNVPLAQEEHFATPVPTPRRSRSQSQMSRMTDDDRTSRGADSTILDVNDAMADSKFIVEMQETNGYAVIRKEPPPRPPAPLRRKKSTKSLGDRQFFTMPKEKPQQTDLDDQPMRPIRNYSTLLPNRPPRRKSATSLVDMMQPSDADGSQYEEINDDPKSHSNLQSGEILSKMKDRPLPPPPRPPRERKQPKHRFGNQQKDDDDDRDGGGERIRIPDAVSESDVLSQYIEEVEVSTQTDPLPDDFQCEEFEITPDMRTITPTQSKINFNYYDNNNQIPDTTPAYHENHSSIPSNDDECLTRGIQRFRESSQRSYSEKSRGSTSKPSSRPTTPALITLEKKISTTPDSFDQTVSATLFVQPLELTDGRDEDEIMEEMIREEEEQEILRQQVLQDEKQKMLEEEERQQIMREHFIEESKRIEQQQKFEEEIRQIKEQRQAEDRKREEQRQIEEDRKREDEQKEIEAEITREKENRAKMEEEQKREQEMIGQADLNVDGTENQQQFEEHREHIIRSNLLSEQKPKETKADSFDQSLVEELDLQVSENDQPIAPPRRKTSGEEQQQQLTIQQQIEALETHRLHLSSLDIDRLNVNALHAGRIMASKLETVSINTHNIHCESGNLAFRTVDDLPAGFIEEIVERVREQQHQEQQKLQEEAPQKDEPVNNLDPQIPEPPEDRQVPPTRPPLPPQPYFHPDYLPYSMPPPSFYQLRNYSDEEPNHQQHRSPPSHRKRHQKKRDSTSEEDHQKEHEKNKRSNRPAIHSPEHTIAELSGQLVRRCANNINDFGQQLMAILRASSKDENRRDLHVALIILIVIFAGLIMLGYTTNKAIHHHHWDYFNPPGSEGRH